MSKIGYDEYGQRSFIEYGNGVKTAYTYDENRRWLDSIETLSATQKLLQNMSYSFDRVGNVSGYTNDSGNYSTTQKYSYDSLYQLVGAKGFTGHVITVIGVNRDNKGNVSSINYIEGHMEGQEQTVYTFTQENGNGTFSLHGRYSDCIFIGWGEFEIK